MNSQKVVGYTSGVFDMFHVGHLRILSRARSLCDHLIVGVSTDELVQSYKNKTPIIPYSDRAEIVSAVSYVDQVVAQNNRDKFSAWEQHKFNVMFVGDDWKGKPVFLEAERKLKSVNVEVVYFPYTNSISSSRLTKVLEAIERNGSLI
ncbi:MAG: adenylyltransferase/cytidyltransferase family protein [Paracoccaceae bacterium]